VKAHAPGSSLRFALIVLDGVGDRPCPELGGKTPLEAARTPHLDGLAERGELGLAYPVGQGVAPESDAGVLGLLGYDPEADYPGRGVLETEGLGIHLKEGEVAFRANFATFSRDGGILDQRVGRSLGTDEARELATALSDPESLTGRGVQVRVLATVGHRAVVILSPPSARPFSSLVSNSDPFYQKLGGMGKAVSVKDPRPLPVRPLGTSADARWTAECANLFLDTVGPRLRDHPVNLARRERSLLEANGLLLRDAGVPTDRDLSFSKRWGLPGRALTEMPVERGIARLLGMDDLYVGPLDPARREEGLRERARQCAAALRPGELLYVHLKGPDEPGHDGKAGLKREVIEAIDHSFFGPLLRGVDLTTTRILVTADHATPCTLKGHSDDPVPVLVGGGDVRGGPARRAQRFTEVDARGGSLGTLTGKAILRSLLEGTPRSHVP
jgi:2,3-bisphosphoglycerate-independent phosphoglycerate mutase